MPKHKKDSDGKDARKHLSCQRCRERKVKCNQSHPCSGCIKAGVECVQVTFDKRSKRPPANYVSELEDHITKLQNIWSEIKKANPKERDILINTVSEFSRFPDKLSNSEGNGEPGAGDRLYDTGDADTAVSDASVSAKGAKQSHKPASDNSVYGPTSVYHNDLITNPILRLKHDESTIKSLKNDTDILHCVKTFFTWQYPDHNMFLFREAFLIDFFNPKPTSLYCSRALILAICALGARMSEVDRIYDKSQQYYNEARGLLLSKLDHPSIASLQGFLLLAFYDICNGNNSSGWMLSGNAFRMGHDIGFQLNPSVWFMKSRDGSELSELDIAIRSRIYWGSYMADHFISLLLGRPSLLKMSEASIPETDYLPDLEWIDEFMYQDPTNKHKVKEEMSNISSPLKNVIRLINISESMLTDIFTRSEAEIDDSTNDDLDISSRLEKLSQYNAKIMKWKLELPEDLSWDREHLEKAGDNPVLSCIRYYYYILILCLNRPFVGVANKKATTPNPLASSASMESKRSSSSSPSAICEGAIDDLHKAIYRFQQVHGLRKASIFIVYCSILSISVLLLTNNSKQLVDDKKEKLDFFLNVLKGCSKTWNLAEKSYKLIKIKLKSILEEEESTKMEPSYSLNESSVNTMNTSTTTSSTFQIPTTIQGIANPPVIKSEFPESPHIGVSSPRSNNLNNRRTSIAFLNELTKENDLYNLHHSQTQSQQHPHFMNNNNTSNAHQAQFDVSNLQNGNSTYAKQRGYPNLNQAQLQAAQTQAQTHVNNAPIDMKSMSSYETDENLDFFGGPPVLMTSDLFNEDWESLFPDYIFNPHN